MQKMGKQDDLVVAVRRSDLQTVVKLLGKSQSSKSKLMGSGKKLNINQLDNNGLSPLHQAAASGNVDITKALLEHGASVDLTDHKGIRPLHLAVEGGHLELVSLLIQRGASSCNPSFDDVTPLHIACQRGHIRIVELLLQHGADPTVTNSLRKTPLDLACENGHETIVDVLLSNPDGPCRRLLKVTDAKAQNDLFLTSCLHLAAGKGHVNIVSRLLDAGCDVNRCTRDGTSLHVAVAGGHLDVVTLLLARGIDLSRVNSYKQTAHDVASRLPQSREFLQLKQLLQQAANETTLSQPPIPYVGTNIYDIQSQEVDYPDTKGCNEHKPCACSSLGIKPGGDQLRCADCSSSSSRSKSLTIAQPVPDVVHCASLATARRPSDSAVLSRRHHGNDKETASQYIVAPILSNTDLSQDCGSVVLHASFDSPEKQSARSASIRYTPNTSNLPRSRSPVDQIVTLPSDDTTDGMRTVRGTDSPGSSNSSSGSSGYLSSTGQIPMVSGLPPAAAAGLSTRQQYRLSGHSYESGMASSCASSSRHSYLSVASSSSHSSLNRLPEDDESAYCSVISISELYERGCSEPEIVRNWLYELHLEEYWQLFVNAGYDMPTISRMTPEDLTAIGITQPAVRKKLTAEISLLHTLINDGIPNYRPNDLKEWLRLLRLEEYYETLSTDGCYGDMDKVTDITWEDLEEIGIKKLGHQKKIILAIDRLKKLKTPVRRIEHSAVEHQTLPPPRLSEVPYPPTLHPIQDGRQYFSLSAASSPGPRSAGLRESSFSFESPSLTNASGQSDYRAAIPVRTPEIVHPMPARRSPMIGRPEVVPIQVKRSSVPHGNTDITVTANVNANNPVYESFHGISQSRDMHSFVKSGESSGELVEAQRTRWNSGGSSLSVHDSPVCQRGSQLTVASDNSLLDSAMTINDSPMKSPQAQLGSGTSLRRIPPAPPRRTNSIRAVDGIGSSKNEDVPYTHYATASLGRKKTSSAVNSELHVAVSNGDLSYGSSEFESNAEFGYQTLRPSKAGCSLLQTPVNSSRETIDSFSAGDCGTLPFANENVGTIRPRIASHSTGCSTGSASSSFDYDTHTLRRKGPKKPLSNLVTAAANNVEADSSTLNPSANVEYAKNVDNGVSTNETGAAGVFDDIEIMFHGLTNELNELLTQPE